MQKELLKIASKIEDLPEELEKIRENGRFAEDYKREQIEDKVSEFKEFAEEQFNKAEKDLEDTEEKAREKLKDLETGDYDRRQYEYSKAATELDHYDSATEFLEQKAEAANDPVELQEARKAALARAKATDQVNYEDIKQVAANKALTEEEREARRKLAKVDLKKTNLENARNGFNYDLEDVKNGQTEVAKTTLLAYGKDDDIDQKAEKKIADTLG